MSEANGSEIEFRVRALERRASNDADWHDEMVQAQKDLGERLRGTHGVALDAVAGINALHLSVKELRKHVDAIQLAVEAMLKPVVRKKAR